MGSGFCCVEAVLPWGGAGWDAGRGAFHQDRGGEAAGVGNTFRECAAKEKRVMGRLRVGREGKAAGQENC